MKRVIVITLLFLFFLCILAPIAARADWYTDGAYRSPGYWHYNTQTRYVAEPYNSDFADMARRAESGQEYASPEVFYVTAEDAQDAETQLQRAVEYAPHSIVITFAKTADAVEFYECYSEWRENCDSPDALIGAVWTRRDQLFAIARSGRSVIITVDRYAEGWLCYVDTSPVIRVYADSNYSRSLLAYRHSIEMFDAAKIITLIGETVEYDYDEYDRIKGNGGYVEDEVAHSVRGAVQRGRAVCDGYAATVQFALACVGTKAFEVIEYNGQANHAYNMVLMGGTWTRVDALKVKPSGGAVLRWVRDVYMEVN